MVRTCFALLLGLALAAPSVFAENWPQWRGPSRDGKSTETGLLQEWPEGGPELLWQVHGLGKGYASVAIAKDKIYTLGQRKGGTSLICLDLKDGAELWATEVGGGNPNCTPTVDVEAGLVFALGRDGDLLCADAETGAEVWKKNFPKDFGGKMMSGWGYSESPLVDGDRLICTPGAQDAIVAALDKKTGETIWKAAMPDIGTRGKEGAGYASIVVSEAAGVRQYIQLTGRGVISVRASDGQTLWGYNRIANGTANIPTPIIKGDYVFCSTGYGTGSALLKLAKNEEGGVDAEEIYFLKGDELQNHHGGMILVGDYIYCGHGHNNGLPVCLEMMTGETKWGPIRGPGRGSAAIVFADGELYFRYENGVMALIEATPEEYRLKGSFELASVNGKSWPHPVILDGKLYLRDQDVLMCYNIAK